LPIFGCDDDTIPDDYPVSKFYKLLRGGPFFAKHKWNVDIAAHVPDILREAGFVNVSHQRRRLPIGFWPKDKVQREIGIHFANIFEEFLAAALVKYKDFGLEEHEAAKLGEDLKKAVYDPRIHVYMSWISVWAQKPPITDNTN
jgi:hypothetical protein